MKLALAGATGFTGSEVLKLASRRAMTCWC
jgi:hypothetical protein